ncbi:1-aminocyclopropane-1-carboxylate deaminase/D-cysteine desulfhydrase [Vibrio marisflavi]|uniref:1-aminocyclopropane-1-carboxylate deaminase n=1 Tax=Vibrio marisflavi CECT 7928 TaxID=634439 RepID=A0ABM9A3T1_9VIBR|nr:1-aminocyclopropane-1-carboxylate deaminase/D-cysteine desulfhydrase [Vibrio marisflavi]CAH0539477.1 hypothetical protein VMF7928_02174 [Vibrio marisflavi CECT 7928]
MKIANSPVTAHTFNGRQFYLKRDDMLHRHFSGNKARKFASLLASENPTIETLISYGSAQANSLYSLAALAYLKNWQLEFYVDRIPAWLEEKPIGNYRGAMDLGAKIIPVSKLENVSHLHPKDYIVHHRKPNESCLFVPEGGYSEVAEYGIKQLADEILKWQQQESIRNLAVALPSGTGTTAAFLAKFLAPCGIEVLTCPCVGGKEYLIDQISKLLNEAPLPRILELESKHHFGKLYQQDYDIWRELKEQTKVEFDLLYDPMMWRCLEPWLQTHQDVELLYIHQGGILGNQSMLPRYQRKYP